MGQRPGADGQTIVDQGTYSELLARGHDLSTLVESQRKSAQDAVDTAAEAKAASTRAAATAATAAAAAAASDTASTTGSTTNAVTSSSDTPKSGVGSAVPPVRPGLSADRAAATSTASSSSRSGTSPVSKARTLGQGGAEYGAVSDSYVVQPSSDTSSISGSSTQHYDEQQRQLYEPDDCPPLEIAEKWRNVLDSAQKMPQKLPQTEHDHLPITPQCAVPMSEVCATT
jgi:hypothetical protein